MPKHIIKLFTEAKEDFKNEKVLINTTQISKSELETEYINVIEEAEKIEITKFCCDMMQLQLSHKCELHDSKYDCPDVLMNFFKENETYVLIIHDGGSSGIQIDYCPWCSSKL